jgi:hypothetical protein
VVIVFCLSSSLSYAADTEPKKFEAGYLYSLPDGKKITVWAPINFSISTTFLKQYAWDNLKDDPLYKDYSWPYLQLSYNNKEVDSAIDKRDLKTMALSGIFVFISDVELITMHPHDVRYPALTLYTTFDLNVATIRTKYLEKNPTLTHMNLTLKACGKGANKGKTINSDRDMNEVLKNIATYSCLRMFHTDQLFWPLKTDE